MGGEVCLSMADSCWCMAETKQYCKAIILQFVAAVVQLLSHVWLFASQWLQHARLPCPLPCLRVCSNSCPLNWWCHPTHLILCRSLLLLPSIFHSIRSLPVSRLFTSGSQSIGASASASVLPMNIHGWFPLGLTGFISLLSKGLSGVFSTTTVWKHQFFGTQPSLWSNSHICYMTTGKTIALIIWTFVGKVMFSLYNKLSRFVTAFLPRSSVN